MVSGVNLDAAMTSERILAMMEAVPADVGSVKGDGVPMAGARRRNLVRAWRRAEMAVLVEALIDVDESCQREMEEVALHLRQRHQELSASGGLRLS